MAAPYTLPDPNDPSLKLAGLSDTEKQSYIDKAMARYAPTKDQYSQLINGQVSANDLQFDDTKSRLNDEANNAITATAQDLDNRGFLRAGVQIAKTQRFKEQSANNIQQADIQRQVSRANLLLQQLGYNSDLDKTAMADATNDINNEFATRKANTGFAQSNYQYQQQQNDAETQRQFQKEMLQKQLEQAQIELDKTRAANSSSSSMDIASLLKSMGMGPQAQETPQAPMDKPTILKSIGPNITQLFTQFKGAPVNGADNPYSSGYAERLGQQLFQQPEYQQAGISYPEIMSAIYAARKPFETAAPTTKNIPYNNAGVGLPSYIGATGNIIHT